MAEYGVSICVKCANTHADKCTWFNPNNQVMPKGCEFNEKTVSQMGVLYEITKCPNFIKDTGRSDIRADMCLSLLEQLNRINEKDYISYFQSIDREFRKPKKKIVVEHYEYFLSKLIDIEKFYRRGVFGLLSEEDAQAAIEQLRRKARERTKQRKRGCRS